MTFISWRMQYKKLLLVIAKKVLVQLALSLGILLFFTFYLGITLSDLVPSFTFSLFLLPVTLAVIYVFSFHLIPHYLLRQRYIWFGIYTIYTIIISTFFIILSVFYAFLFINSLLELKDQFLLSKNLQLIIIGVFMIVILASFFSVLRESYKASIRNKELQYELLDNQLALKHEELSFLKMQIHPHFLFNTLNTIYGSAIAKDEQTPTLILKLSQLLDYILYQTPKSQVPLQDEIDHLKDYIALEELRHGERLKVQADFPAEGHSLLIAPMLFLPFLENSFKHGTSSAHQAQISLQLRIEKGIIVFSLQNTFDSQKHSQQLISSGIGLINIQKRLELLYPEGHQLDLIENTETFEVRLSIDPEKFKHP